MTMMISEEKESNAQHSKIQLYLYYNNIYGADYVLILILIEIIIKASVKMAIMVTLIKRMLITMIKLIDSD